MGHAAQRASGRPADEAKFWATLHVETPGPGGGDGFFAFDTPGDAAAVRRCIDAVKVK